MCTGVGVRLWWEGGPGCTPAWVTLPEVAVGSLSAGVSESPLMTWGEVENTPLRVEGSETPYVDRTPGPAFKVRHGEGSTGGTSGGCVVLSTLGSLHRGWPSCQWSLQG